MSALRDVLTELEATCIGTGLHRDSSVCAECARLDELFARARAELDALDAPQSTSTPCTHAHARGGVCNAMSSFFIRCEDRIGHDGKHWYTIPGGALYYWSDPEKP